MACMDAATSADGECHGCHLDVQRRLLGEMRRLLQYKYWLLCPLLHVNESCGWARRVYDIVACRGTLPSLSIYLRPPFANFPAPTPARYRAEPHT